MSTNEPPADPTADPGGRRPPTEPSVEPIDTEALADQPSSGDEPVTAPPAWQPPSLFEPTGSPAYPAASGAHPAVGGDHPVEDALGDGDVPPPPTGGSSPPGAEPGSDAGASSLGDAGAGYVPGDVRNAPDATSSVEGAPVGYPVGEATTGRALPGGPPPSYPMPPPQAAAPRKRPAVVVAAITLLLILAICGLVQSALSLASLGSTIDRFKERARILGATNSDIDAVVTQMSASYIVGMFLMILLAAALVGLAYGLSRGSNGARIATWVVSGLAILCDCCSAVVYFGIGSIDITASGADDLQTQLGQAQLDAFPSWFLTTSGGISLLQLLGYIATAVLLALPAANAFFKKTAPGWVPPTP